MCVCVCECVVKAKNEQVGLEHRAATPFVSLHMAACQTMSGLRVPLWGEPPARELSCLTVPQKGCAKWGSKKILLLSDLKVSDFLVI